MSSVSAVSERYHKLFLYSDGLALKTGVLAYDIARPVEGHYDREVLRHGAQITFKIDSMPSIEQQRIK